MRPRSRRLSLRDMNRNAKITDVAERSGVTHPAPMRSPEGEAKRWKAVADRDASCDGQFVFAVATTGIYCRPSCPARRPRRENVSFYASADSARRAGFRPCKRCHPDGLSPADVAAAKIAEACRSIEAAEEPPKLDQLARAAGLSPAHFQRTFKAIVGLSPKAYAQRVRAARVRESLTKAATVTAAAHSAGYASNSRFYADAACSLGMSAATYRKGGKGERIAYGIGTSSLGLVLVAATDKGLCAVLMGVDGEALTRDLERRFAAATLVNAGPTLDDLIGRVIETIETPAAKTALPLDLHGTVFQHRVWQALLDIPAGETRSYGEIARRIGAASAVRAVARACAANPIAVIVPCHRVVGRDGAITGYRWGKERKHQLLERERKPATGQRPRRERK